MKLAAIEMQMACADRDWDRAISIMESHFGRRLAHITDRRFVQGDLDALEINILLDCHRYVWEEYSGFWSRDSVAGEYIRIFYR